MSVARFSAGTMLLLALLAVLAILLLLARLDYLDIMIVPVAIIVLIVKSVEMIQIGNPQERKLLGQTCLVIKRVTKGEKGVVKVFKEDGSLDHELWSAELELLPAYEEVEIPEKGVARVIGMRGITLLIEPCAQNF